MPHTQGQKGGGGGVEGQENSRLPPEKSTMVTQIIRSFSPSEKPTSHGKVRVVVVVDYFEVMTSKVTVNSFLLKAELLLSYSVISHQNFYLGWDPSISDF